MADGNCISADDVGLDVNTDEALDALNLRVVREEAERRAVVRWARQGKRQRGPRGRGARLSRPTLYDLMNRFGIKKETST